MGFFGSLGAEDYDRQYSNSELMRRIMRYFVSQRRKFWLMMLALSIQALFGAGQPIVIGRAVNALETNLGPQGVLYIVIALFMFGVFVWVSNYIRFRLNSEIIGDMVFSLRSDAFKATVKHDLSFYDRFKSGTIISRITHDSNEFGQVIKLVADVIQQVVVVLILVVVLAFIEWRLTLLVVALAPVIFVAASRFRNIARHVTRQGTRAMGNVNASIQEAVTGISIAKNFRQEEKIYGEFEEVNNESYRINLWRGFILASIFPVLNALVGVGSALLIYFGGRAAGIGLISAGAWYLFLISVDRFWFPVISISSFWSQFQAGLSAAERIFALIDAESAVVQTAAVQVPRLRGEICFDHVSFRYSDQEQVLDDFSLTIAPGESVALVGHTGAGKSSVVKLIERFYEFQEGRITVDDYDIRTLEMHHYRQQLGIVSQVPFLFSGSVADNIRYACPQASDEDILRVARSIGEGEWLETLPDGLDSAVGERGQRLSMGQRQLVALTRVLVQGPAIFILDEATASIDPFTESQIQAALDMILANSTSILIAHRLSTVRSADRIIVLRTGSIIEEGNHSQLMAQGGHYAELYNSYFRHQSLEYIEQARELLQEMPGPQAAD